MNTEFSVVPGDTGCMAGVYVGDGIYLQGEDEPLPYAPTVRVVNSQ